MSHREAKTEDKGSATTSKYRDERGMNRSMWETKAGCSSTMPNPVIIKQCPLCIPDYVITNTRKWLQEIR